MKKYIRVCSKCHNTFETDEEHFANTKYGICKQCHTKYIKDGYKLIHNTPYSNFNGCNVYSYVPRNHPLFDGIKEILLYGIE